MMPDIGRLTRQLALCTCGLLLSGGLWTSSVTASDAAAVTEHLPAATTGAASRVSHRSFSGQGRSSRSNARGSVFVTPEARPQNDRRPSDYYQPLPREPRPFYHYNRVPTPPPSALQRDRMRR